MSKQMRTNLVSAVLSLSGVTVSLATDLPLLGIGLAVSGFALAVGNAALTLKFPKWREVEKP